MDEDPNSIFISVCNAPIGSYSYHWFLNAKINIDFSGLFKSDQGTNAFILARLQQFIVLKAFRTVKMYLGSIAPPCFMFLPVCASCNSVRY